MTGEVRRLLRGGTETGVRHETSLIQHPVSLLTLRRDRLLLTDLDGFVADVRSGVEVSRFGKVPGSTIQIGQAGHGLVLLAQDWIEIPPWIGIILLHLLHRTISHIGRVD